MIPKGYKSVLDVRQTEQAIVFVRATFEKELAQALCLTRISAPLFVRQDSGLNDNLSGKERAVSFDVPAAEGAVCEVVHSLAKWKRMALGRYGFLPGEGMYTDMNAIRRDESDLDAIHSVYVDQWDWERVMQQDQRNSAYLHETVRSIYGALVKTQQAVQQKYPEIKAYLPQEIMILTAQELEEAYPDLTPDQREQQAAKIHGAIFIQGIGGALASGNRHDGRAPDYDDWSLNGDLLIWYPVLNRAIELSSMGIRVDASTLSRQLELAGATERKSLPFHAQLLLGKLPQTVGGGLGQSRICMILLQKAHVGEVQVSVWPQSTIVQCESAGVTLL